MVTLTAAQAAYLAGVIDGEGTISLNARMGSANLTPTYTARVYITNTKRAWLETLQQWTGGGSISDGEKRRLNKCPWYQLRWPQYEIRGLLPQILPYLLLKREQAHIVSRYLEVAVKRRAAFVPGVRTGEEFARECADLHARCRVLNQRGIVPTGTEGGPRSTRVCSVEGCGRQYQARGYCRRHYKKYVLRGGPTFYERTCNNCGRAFVTRRNDTQSCSKACADGVYYQTHRTDILARLKQSRGVETPPSC